MTSPAMGIAYLLWLRLRWGGAAALVYLVGLSIAARVLPVDPVIMALCLLTAVIAYLLHVFTLGPADFGVKSSGFPSNMFVLPLLTLALTGWPILYCAGTFAILWVLVVCLVFIPLGFSPPFVWPATIAAASAAWVQAISWTPFPTPFARVPALALAAIPLIVLGTWGAIYNESHTVAALVTAMSLIWIALAHRFAVAGLARARCGADLTWKILPESIRVAFARRTAAIFYHYRRFPSASAAQLWHECRRNVLFLPIMMAFIGLPLLALNCHAVLNPTADRTMLFGTVTVTPATMSLMIWIVVPLMLATSLGQGLGKFDLWGKESMPTFFAMRPMTTTRFVVLKLIAAAISVAACWSAILVYLAIWALVESSSLNTHGSLVRAAVAELTPRRTAIAFAGVLGLTGITWRVIATGVWPCLAGRKLVSNGIAVASWLLLIVAGILGSWIYRHPEIHSKLYSALPWLVGTFLVLKLTTAAAAVYWQLKLNLADISTVVKSVVGWFLFVTALFCGLSQFASPTWLLAAWMVLLVPLTRILLAPLALHLNRHR